MNLPQYNRSPMPMPGSQTDNPELAQMISADPVFSSIAAEVAHERKVQAQRWNYTYTLSDQIVGQQTLPFIITIEQGTDFKSCFLTGSAFSYDAVNASTFPIPNSAGVTAWAGRGLAVRITDTRAGRELTSGFVPFETIFTPGYGINFQKPYPFRYFFYRNTKLRFDIRNADNALRTHAFTIELNGYKILTPQ